MPEGVEPRLVNGVKNHCSDQRAEAGLVRLGGCGGEPVFFVELRQRRWHDVGLQVRKEFAESWHAQGQNRGRFWRNLAQEPLREGFLPYNRYGEQSLSNRQLKDRRKLWPGVGGMFDESKTTSSNHFAKETKSNGQKKIADVDLCKFFVRASLHPKWQCGRSDRAWAFPTYNFSVSAGAPCLARRASEHSNNNAIVYQSQKILEIGRVQNIVASIFRDNVNRHDQETDVVHVVEGINKIPDAPTSAKSSI